jgi:hypothetical protein
LLPPSVKFEVQHYLFMFDVPKYRPGVSRRIQAPFVICAAEHDPEANPNIAAEVAKEAPHGEFKLYPGGC